VRAPSGNTTTESRPAKPQDRAYDKRSEDDLESHRLGQDGEADQEEQGAAHPDLGARVLQVSMDPAQPSEVFDFGDRDPYGRDEHPVSAWEVIWISSSSIAAKSVFRDSDKVGCAKMVSLRIV
jgi:hypothetical protein